ncbi:MAG TPA: DUF397 domain-containing protein [Pseudonocardiaceae bacterium]|jgi:hypothetical protein|nr:DUF397 domain-containing protein [Pseudonocardiaceae bacterium]
MSGRRRARVIEAEPSGRVWRKSSSSTDKDCVEVAVVAERVLVRVSRRRSGPMLAFPAPAWAAFAAAVTQPKPTHAGLGAGHLELP